MELDRRTKRVFLRLGQRTRYDLLRAGPQLVLPHLRPLTPTRLTGVVFLLGSVSHLFCYRTLLADWTEFGVRVVCRQIHQLYSVVVPG